MSTFKQYSKMAKERLKNGFWENARKEMAHEKEVAATLGIDSRQVVEQQRRKLEKQILQSDELVLNPIMRLADQNYMQTLTPTEKQTYITKLAARYRKAVEYITKFGV